MRQFLNIPEIITILICIPGYIDRKSLWLLVHITRMARRGQASEH
jgi:hypothetical protein